ncbi:MULTISPECIES: hypothetical protein [unclassified Anaerobiospirillum]|uniref:hypothetical protein n=1 Tax=unclassified Anaerobiospirillum TaxID=2647410 RepID=UPI001FF131BA|nr:MULTISPECIES: hypothetical protein [unclassified Anaerobiospirillum]MCK0527231.1 hypothetical protein [Anaerobiospirillum sp. NML120449]MCK0536032.1 hypothetical protein [Anaerobiospirillum sp. NML120511]MCK0541209.1 hypothetical protein [Anaerobiospirillum sp. NML02-A-032]
MHTEEQYLQLLKRCERLEQDNEKMQERIAWLELSLHENGTFLDEMLRRMDKAEKQIRFLASMQSEPSAVRPESEETPPPHY